MKCSEPTNTKTTAAYPRLTASRKFARETGLSDVSLWRYESRGWLHPVWIASKKYYTGEDLEQFIARAKAGEFRKSPAGACAKHGGGK